MSGRANVHATAAPSSSERNPHLMSRRRCTAITTGTGRKSFALVPGDIIAQDGRSAPLLGRGRADGDHFIHAARFTSRGGLQGVIGRHKGFGMLAYRSGEFPVHLLLL